MDKPRASIVYWPTSDPSPTPHCPFCGILIIDDNIEFVQDSMCEHVAFTMPFVIDACTYMSDDFKAKLEASGLDIGEARSDYDGEIDHGYEWMEDLLGRLGYGHEFHLMIYEWEAIMHGPVTDGCMIGFDFWSVVPGPFEDDESSQSED